MSETTSSTSSTFFAVIVLSVIVLGSGFDAGDTTLRFVGDEPKQTWGYVPVRKDAYMFWWLYYTSAAEGYKNRPLVIWLQGGPGGSSTGFGNFLEIGPLDVNLNARATSWVSKASVLFIDNPVGTGFSYVTDDKAYTTDVTMIADDLVTLLTTFMKKIPDFQNIPLYIFSESYGGKMTAAFSLALHKAIKSGSVKSNFKGLAMGDSWISPVDSIMTWGPYLRATSLVDLKGLNAINAGAAASKAAVDKGQYAKATDLWSILEEIVETHAGGVNFYNILKWKSTESNLTATWKRTLKSFGVENIHLAKLYNRHVAVMQDDKLSELMNGHIRRKLGIIPTDVTWGGQSEEVFQKQSTDFMKPVVNIVDELLQTTDLKVIVYSGQLDLICDSLGTEQWVQRLKWPGLSEYNDANHSKVQDKTGKPLYFVKSYKNFSFYWILNAGHMVPTDAGEAALMMLEMATRKD